MATTSPPIPDPMENLSPVFGHRRPFSPSAMLNPRSQLDGTPKKVGYLWRLHDVAMLAVKFGG